MVRIKFKEGEQRKFLEEVLMNLNCPSLRAFLQFGFDIPYSTLKNYYSGKRLLPEKLFIDFCNFSRIDFKKYSYETLSDNWGQIKGGSLGKNKNK
jgi:hypothetical protein